jgi:threonine dehydrogenase-like Zn-dependent dehydrogenase
MMGSNMGPIPVASLAIMFNCWKIVGTRNCTHRDALQSIDWLASGTLEIEDLITHRFPLQDINDAAKAVKERQGKTWMTVVNP